MSTSEYVKDITHEISLILNLSFSSQRNAIKKKVEQQQEKLQKKQERKAAAAASAV